jgi:putative ATP-dependent endonuclease of the OLD family
MRIRLQSVRIKGFRGFRNIEVDFENTTVLVGTNNAGKTTLLKALQLALTNFHFISNDDFFYCEEHIDDTIIVDVLFVPLDEDGNVTNEFNEVWNDVFKAERIGISQDGKQIMAFRTIIKENNKTFRKQQFYIDQWEEFLNEEINWYDNEYDKELSFYFDEIPFFYLEANRDILEDIKSKSSYLGRILSSLEFSLENKQKIEALISELNSTTIGSSDILTELETTLKELDTAMDNTNNTVQLTPFTKKVRDLNKGIRINYSEFSMDYHGMGTRSWSSLLVLKSFLNLNHKIYEDNGKPYYPILAIEEPESHLHPNAQKKLYSQINEIVGQKIISTHSNYIAANANLSEIRSLIKKESNITIGKLLIDNLDDEDNRKIRRQVINTRGELFFSKVVILCEGETEEQSLPLLIEKQLNLDMVSIGINIIGINGGGNYFPFIYFCESLGIKWFILSDGENPILKKIKKDMIKLNQLTVSVEDYEFPDNIIHFENQEDFERHLINNGFKEEIEETLKEIYGDDIDSIILRKHGTVLKRQPTRDKCSGCNQFIFKDILRVYNTDEGRLEAYNELLSDKKTIYPSILSQKIFESEKPVPPKINELFNKINAILNPEEDEQN